MHSMLQRPGSLLWAWRMPVLVLALLLQACAESPTTTLEAIGEGKDYAPEPASAIQWDAQLKQASSPDFMAVTANPHATEAAYAMLARGGSAVDAAIAAQLVLGLVEPQSSGVGGGGFMLYWRAEDRRLWSYDGRETAPSSASETLFLGPDQAPMGFFDALIGGRSVGVPGLLLMLEQAHLSHGLLPWDELFEPAIELAERGFVVSPRLQLLIERVPRVAERQGISSYLFDSAGEPLQAGALLKNPAYAQSLRTIAAGGSDAFYSGEIARRIVQAVNTDTNPGELSLQDMASYQVVARRPVCARVFDHKVCGMPPPSSGGLTVLSILGVLEQLESEWLRPQRAGTGVAADRQLAHAYIEASRLAFADRNTYIADPDFVDVPVEGLLSDEYWRERAQLIDPGSALSTVLPGSPPGFDASTRVAAKSPELVSTTHLSIVDSQGNAVSMTTSIETAFGSRLMVDGFLLNNQLTDFSFSPVDEQRHKVANRVEGSKRPRSSMSPTMVFDADDQLVLVTGSPGGKKIIGYVARTLYESMRLGMPLEDSVQAPHLLHLGRQLEYEAGFDAQLLEWLAQLGHEPRQRFQTSGIHLVYRQDEHWVGVADPRREGSAKGGQD